MLDEADELREQVTALRQEVAALKGARLRGVRKRSATQILGMPLYDIAIGPDTTTGQMRGHARGFIAIGDTALGVFALGGFAVGLIAVGGCSIGLLLAVGGGAFGAVAIGGLAVGAVALGGAAAGFVAIGGGAYGYYACGGGAAGKHVIDSVQQDPEAVRFFQQWIPGLEQLIKRQG
jgi:hypothetical protein